MRVLHPHPLKTPENLWFSDVFRGYKMKRLATSKLMPRETFMRVVRRFSQIHLEKLNLKNVDVS